MGFQHKKLFAGLLAVGILIGGGTAFAGGDRGEGPVSADGRSRLPKDWISPETGNIDLARVPARIRASSGNLASGYGWIDSAAFMAPPKSPDDSPRQLPVYETETGDNVIGTFTSGRGITPNAGWESKTPEEVTTATTVLVDSR